MAAYHEMLTVYARSIPEIDTMDNQPFHSYDQGHPQGQSKDPCFDLKVQGEDQKDFKICPQRQTRPRTKTNDNIPVSHQFQIQLTAGLPTA